MKLKALLSLTATLAVAAAPVSPAAPMGTAFTYQGKLNDAGLPANGTYDFTFGLWTDDDAGGLVFSPFGNPRVLTGVPVQNGLFTVMLDFGATAFAAGEARWLETGARTNGSITFDPLAPRQRVSPAPQAVHAGSATTAASADTAPWSGLSGLPAGFADGVDDDTTYTAGPGLLLSGNAFLVNTNYLAASGFGQFWGFRGNTGTDPGLGYFIGTRDDQPLEVRVNNQRVARFEPRPVSPNVVLGEGSNLAGAGAEGATVSGGGQADISGNLRNLAAGNFSTVAGGIGNLVVGTPGLSAFSAISGGSYNTARGVGVTVGGGSTNWADGFHVTVGGGARNHAAALLPTIGGGLNNTNTGHYATIAGGIRNVATGQDATIAGGSQNQALGGQSAVLGGIANLASNTAATVLGGQQNSATNSFSTAAGLGALTRRSHAHARGAMFASPGDGQSVEYVLTGTTAGTTALDVPGPGVPFSGAIAFTALVSAKAFGDAAAAFEVKGLIRNYGGEVALVGSPIVTIINREGVLASATVAAQANNIADQLEFRLQSATALNVRWVISLSTSEVVF